MCGDASELREKSAKALGWHEHWRIIDPRCPGQRAYYDERQEFRCTIANFTPDTDANQNSLLLAEVERRGRERVFAEALTNIIKGPSVFNDLVWQIANATPEQKTRAAVEALTNGEAGK